MRFNDRLVGGKFNSVWWLIFVVSAPNVPRFFVISCTALVTTNVVTISSARESKSKIKSFSLLIEKRKQNVISFYHPGICQQKWPRMRFEPKEIWISFAAIFAAAPQTDKSFWRSVISFQLWHGRFDRSIIGQLA